MIVKTSELKGAALDWAVCMAVHGKDSREVWAHPSDDPGNPYPVKGGYRPSTDWAHGGPLIERYGFAVSPYAEGDFYLGEKQTVVGYWVEGPGADQIGPTILIAAMRAIVDAELGDEVDVPEGLA